MVPVYASIGLLFYVYVKLRNEMGILRRRLNRLELSGYGAMQRAAFCYKPLLTIQEQIAEELHL